MPIKQVITDQRVPVKIWTDDVDQRSKKQLSNITSLPFIHHHVAAMPDVHFGIGATIGSVIATHIRHCEKRRLIFTASHRPRLFTLRPSEPGVSMAIAWRCTARRSRIAATTCSGTGVLGCFMDRVFSPVTWTANSKRPDSTR
jgi:hypothetical protein